MTSPYLQRPKRSLHQAIRDTGRSPDELGMNGAETAIPLHTASPGAKGPFRLSGFHMVLGVIVCAGLLTGGLLISARDQHQAPIAERGTETGADIVPASGPSGVGSSIDGTDPSAPIDTQDWETAPELTPLQPTRQSTN